MSRLTSRKPLGSLGGELLGIGEGRLEEDQRVAALFEKMALND